MPPKRSTPRTTKSKPKSRTSRPSTKKPPPSDTDLQHAFSLFSISASDLPEDEFEALDIDDEDASDGLLKVLDVRRALTALNLPKPPADFFEDGQEFLTLGEFMGLAAVLAEGDGGEEGAEEEDEEMDESGDARVAVKGKKAKGGGRKRKVDTEVEEIDHAYSLFLHSVPTEPTAAAKHEEQNASIDRNITLADLQRVARELRENVDDKVLLMMLEEATGLSGRDALGQGVDREQFEEVMRRAGVFG